MKKIGLFVLLAALTAATGFGQAVKLDGLFLTMQRIGGGYSPTYLWFRTDGRVLATAPGGGLTPNDFQEGCTKAPTYCGTFKQTGDKVAITINGKTNTSTINKAEGGFQVDGLATIKAELFPAGTKLNGSYNGDGPRLAVSTGSGNSVASAHSYTFRPDGTFSRESVGSVRTSVSSATSTNAAGGTYKLSANTLELSENGKTVRHLAFFPYDGAIVIDGIICSKRK